MNLPKPVVYGLMAIAIVAAFFGGTYISHLWRDASPEEQAAKEMQHKTRPLFMLPDVAGGMRNVTEWDGKVLVLNFWATWCPPCRREMPGFVELQNRFSEQGLQFVGIALDDARAVREFIDTNSINYPVLLGGEAAIAVSHQFGNRFDALPYTAVIARNGEIIATFRGEVDMSSVENLIKQAI